MPRSIRLPPPRLDESARHRLPCSSVPSMVSPPRSRTASAWTLACLSTPAHRPGTGRCCFSSSWPV
jgi:hypothetical protein